MYMHVYFDFFYIRIAVWNRDSVKHVPGFIEKAEEFKAKGVSEILLISGMVS